MQPPLSNFGTRLAAASGIGELMKDLGETLATADDSLCMLGGGQPAHIPEVDQIWHRRLCEIADDPVAAIRMLGDYQPPSGDARFRESVAAFFRRKYGWPIDQSNVCITAGGQTAFFLMINALAGRFQDGSNRKILLPLVPEYIGYADQSATEDIFRAAKPKIEKVGDHEFKYVIDFDAIEVDESVAAICLSRPTNPSANVVTDEELQRLAELASANDIPLIVDNAYGDPFPAAIFSDTTPVWNESMVLTYSLSKMGLPGTRTGIVVGPPAIVDALSEMNAITSLANNNVGQTLIQPLLDNDQIAAISDQWIRPFYSERAKLAFECLCEALDESIPFRVHLRQGAFFLWLWLEGLPISSAELYQRLKQRGVLVISGHYFFYGMQDPDWTHQHECLRISFTTQEDVLRRGLSIMGDEINRLYR